MLIVDSKLPSRRSKYDTLHVYSLTFDIFKYLPSLIVSIVQIETNHLTGFVCEFKSLNIFKIL